MLVEGIPGFPTMARAMLGVPLKLAMDCGVGGCGALGIEKSCGIPPLVVRAMGEDDEPGAPSAIPAPRRI